MVNGEDIVAAEKTLQIVYGGDPGRSLLRMEVDRDAFDGFVSEKRGQLIKRYGNAWHEMDPRLEPAINTLLVHFFLVGLVCGHNEMRRRT